MHVRRSGIRGNVIIVGKFMVLRNERRIQPKRFSRHEQFIFRQLVDKQFPQRRKRGGKRRRLELVGFNRKFDEQFVFCRLVDKQFPQRRKRSRTQRRMELVGFNRRLDKQFVFCRLVDEQFLYRRKRSRTQRRRKFIGFDGKLVRRNFRNRRKLTFNGDSDFRRVENQINPSEQKDGVRHTAGRD